MDPGLARRVVRGCAGVLLLGGISGCTPEAQSAVPTSSSVPSVTTEPIEPDAAPDRPSSASTPTPTPTGSCSPAELYEPWSSDKASLGTLGGNRMRIPSDQGPRDHASGDAVTDDAGHPVAYVVAPDDVSTVVAERFCLHVDYIDALNQVRRNSAATLYAGDTLNLDPYTVTSVGSENGVVHDNPPPRPLPPQR